MRQAVAAAIISFQLALAGTAGACEIAAPKGEAILVISGMINACNEGLEVQMDKAMIQALPRHKITTENPWDKGSSTYEGPSLGDLMRFARADGKSVVIAALNDYRSEIPLADLDRYGVILADMRNGAELPVRDKGPLFVVFPFTDMPELKTESRYAQSVWQVNRITVK